MHSPIDSKWQSLAVECFKLMKALEGSIERLQKIRAAL